MKIRTVAFVLMTLLSCAIFAQEKITRAKYIEMWKDEAIREMNEFGIPASITLAQGIFESGDGNSVLAREANNHFGIKCHGEAWNGDVFHYDDDEKQECFRKYVDARQSYSDHSKFLRSRSRYASLFDLEITDYVGWAKGLKAAGYATLPTYAERIIKIIEDNNLAQYDAFYGVEYNPNREINEGTEIEVGSDEVDMDKDTVETVDAKRMNLKNAVAPMSKYVKTSDSGRKIYKNNGKRYVVIKAGDNEDKIASEFDIFTAQLRKYNDLNKKKSIKEGDIIYVDAKKNSNGKMKKYVVREGEDLWYISQLFGVKMKQLAKKNGIAKGVIEIPVGRTIML